MYLYISNASKTIKYLNALNYKTKTLYIS